MPAPIPHEQLACAVRAAFGRDAAITALEPLTGDASSRRYVRLRLAGGRTPATAVAMLLGAEQRFGPGGDEAGSGPADDELPFVNVARYLARHGFEVPAIYHDASA